MDNLLTYDEAAKKLMISYRKLLYLIKDGIIPVCQIGKRSPRIAKESLEKYVKSVQAVKGN